MSKYAMGSLLGVLGITAILLGFALAPPVDASPTVKFNVNLQPERLGGSTTIGVGFEIPVVSGEAPSPLTTFDVHLPVGMGLAGTSLGVATCSAGTLMRFGPRGCPPDSAMGFGNGVAETGFGSEVVRESGRVLAFMTQAIDNKTTILYYFDGRAPVIAPLVFFSELLSPGDSPISELVMALPLIHALPETQDATIVSMHVTLGPKNLTYYKHVGKKVVGYSPVGIAVPTTCPKGGFRFPAYFGFANGERVSVVKKVPCP